MRISLFRTCFAVVAFIVGPAHAACPANNQYRFLFSNQTATTLAYGSTYTYTASTPLGATQTFTVGFTQNGVTNVAVAGENRPNISASHNGGGTALALVVGGVLSGRTTNIAGATRVMVTTFTFPVPVRDVTFTVHDVDFGANQFRDWLQITGTGAATYTGAHTTPFGTNNGAGPYDTALSSLNLGPDTTPFTITAQQAVGTTVSDNNSTTGNITASFVQPVTSVQIRYGNHPFTAGENTTGQQAFAINGVSYCPMPVVTSAKTSAPFSDPVNGTTNPKLIPGGDLIYTLTVTNSNASTLAGADLPALTDLLPPNVTFYNGDIDDGGPLTGNFEFVPGTSGLSLAAGNVTYTNNNGSTYAYTPAAGYDAAVDGVRYAPTGTFNANSSFSIRFRTRIN